MKNLFSLFALTLLLGMGNLNAQVAKTVALKTPAVEAMKISEAVSWDKMQIDLGQIPQNIPAPVEFTLTNNSNEPMILKNVKGSCGCTATDYDTNPIQPGETSVIKATYNAKKVGHFTKMVSVTTSLDETPIKLTLKGEVIAE